MIVENLASCGHVEVAMPPALGAVGKHSAGGFGQQRLRTNGGLRPNYGSQPTVGAPSNRASCSVRALRAACG